MWVRLPSPAFLAQQHYLRFNKALYLPGNAFIAFGLPAGKKLATLALRPVLLASWGLIAGEAQDASFDLPKCCHRALQSETEA
jgi:hypothetical protein